MKRLMKWSMIPALSSIVLLGSCSSGETIKIGAATYTETKIMAEVYKALIEDRTDIHVDVTPDLLSNPMIIKSMDRADLDMALMYTGVIFNNFFDVKETTDRDEVLKQAQEGFQEYYDFTWYDPLGWENAYALTVRGEYADELGLETISDLGEHQDQMRFGVDSSWMERQQDGYPAFVEHYDFTFQNTYAMDINLVYEAVAQEEVEVVLAYSTDPRLYEFDLKTLEDDKSFFPPYDASMLVRNETLEKYPEIDEIMKELIGSMDEELVTRLNYEVDINNRSERDVAIEFLQSRDLLSE